ncbi:MAG: T9SS type A sorting domain-containing protein [Bacteroidota bacterium]
MKISTATGILLILSFLPLQATEPDTVFNSLFRRDIGGWIAADATYSIPLPDGRTLWLFGDTFIGSVEENGSAIVPGAKFIRNSAVIQEGEAMSTLTGGTRTAPSDFIPTEYPDSIWYWPEQGIVDNDTLRIFVSRFATDPTQPAGWNFKQIGSCIASYSYPGLEYIGKTPLPVFDLNGVIYGDRLLADSGYIYIYGRRTDDPSINIAYPHVARTLQGELMKQQWEYFTGSDWSNDPTDTKRMNNFQVSQQYSVSEYKGKYILLTQDIWLSPKIYSFTSFSPTGPWSNKRLLYTTPETEGSTFTYNAYVHPQFNRDDEMLVSYNVNGDFFSIFSNVEIYRPRFIRVPYMNLDFWYWPNGTEQKTAGEDLHFSIAPNPVGSEAVVSFHLPASAPVRIRLSDTAGRVVLNLPVRQADGGENRIVLPMNDLQAGYYFVNIEYQSGSYTLPVIKYNPGY